MVITKILTFHVSSIQSDFDLVKVCFHTLMLFILKLRATLLFIQRAPNNFIKVPEPVMFSYITKRERDMYKICMS